MIQFDVRGLRDDHPLEEGRNVKDSDAIVAIYDFEIFPFALGDVLTWNVRTAMRCEELGRDRVDVYICANEGCLGNVHQHGIVNVQNFDLLFNELYSAFGTHPRLGNIHIFRRRHVMISRLQEIVADDAVNSEAVQDYLNVLNYRVVESPINRAWMHLFRRLYGNRFVRSIVNRHLPPAVKNLARNAIVSAAFLPDYQVINHYFTKYVVSHESINDFAARHGRIPLLRAAMGCEPDIEELISRRFVGKKIVTFHLRMRRLDTGYGGEHSYARDSDFLEWYDFLSAAARLYPEVEFVALGRLQEKPLEVLRLPNVTSLRLFGMGLGHELTMMLKSDLFIGSSSGFAAFANFSEAPYFVTQMTSEACHVYEIAEGAERLPFALEKQKLIYGQESSELLLGLLKDGLDLPERVHSGCCANEGERIHENIDIPAWLNARLQVRNSAATTSRFFVDDTDRHRETAYLLLLSLEKAKQALLSEAPDKAEEILQRMERNFPELCKRLPALAVFKNVLNDTNLTADAMFAVLKTLNIEMSGFVGATCPITSTPEEAWSPANFAIGGSVCRPISESRQPAFAIQASGRNSYWHTERFVSGRPDGRIVVRFEAKNSVEKSCHRIHQMEDGRHYCVGQFIAEPEWLAFEIPITTNPGCHLAFQIDQQDDWQWLMIRNFRVVHGRALPLIAKSPVIVPMVNWTSNWEAGVPCADALGGNCLQWKVESRKGYVQTPLLPDLGDYALMVSFEARTDQFVTSFTPVYLFEGGTYRVVAQYALGMEWRAFSLLLQPGRGVPLRIQIDFPESVELLAIRNFQVTPAIVDRASMTEGVAAVS
jgi:hypothetical protein